MTTESHRQLVEFLEQHVDDYLRGVAAYTTTDYDVLYLRDDLKAERVRSELDQMIERLRQERRVREQQAFPFGELTGTVRAFEDAMVMHYPYTQERGTVITFDPGVGRDLNTFMHECQQRINY